MFPSLPAVFNQFSLLHPPPTPSLVNPALLCLEWCVSPVSCNRMPHWFIVLSAADEGWHSRVHTWRRMMKDVFPWRWNPCLTKAAAGELDSPNAEVEGLLMRKRSSSWPIAHSVCIVFTYFYIRSATGWWEDSLRKTVGWRSHVSSPRERQVSSIKGTFHRWHATAGTWQLCFAVLSCLVCFDSAPSFPTFPLCFFCTAAISTPPNLLAHRLGGW